MCVEQHELSVFIQSKEVESNPATSKVTTDAEDAAEVFSNNEVAFCGHLLLHVPAKAGTAS